MKIAIVGGGISGLTCGWLLRHQHEVTLFEDAPQPGGHSNTVSIEYEGESQQIDTGFIVCNDRTYPQFLRLLAQLNVEPVPTSMSFAVRCDRTGIEYCGSSLNGLFAQKRNLCSPRFLKMIADILRFNRIGTAEADSVPTDLTVAEYVRSRGFGRRFTEHYLYPMGAAIWSCPLGTFSEFPIAFILKFYRNHGLLQIRDRPQWFTIPNGSRTYVDRLTADWADQIHCSTPVRAVHRTPAGVRVQTETSDAEFDEVIFACHSDTALQLLAAPSMVEREVLSAFPYEMNDVVLHVDENVLPKQRSAWAAWNYRIPVAAQSRPTVTYNMNILQHLRSRHTYSVTLNDTDSIRPECILSRHRYSHPVFSLSQSTMQARHADLIRADRTSFCGAYWRNGFHEDGVASASRVCEAFGVATLAASDTPAMPEAVA
jgi:predicted NAD/FAD-binding protein